MSKRTLGLWRYEKDKFNDDNQVSDQQTGSICATDAGGLEWFICAIEDTCIDGETEANARLIAESPDMLAILKMLIDAQWIEGEAGYLAQRDALAKAQEIVERLEQEMNHE